MAIAPGGRVALAFLHGNRDRTITVRRGTSFATVRGARFPFDLAVAATDRATAVLWDTESPMIVRVSVARADGGFGRPQTLGRVGGFTELPSLRIVGAGDRFVAVWTGQHRRPGEVSVFASVSDAAGRFGPVQVLTHTALGTSLSDRPPGDLTVRAAPDGSVRALWTSSAGDAFAVATLALGAETFAAPVVTTVPNVTGARLGAGPGAANAAVWAAGSTAPPVLYDPPFTIKPPDPGTVTIGAAFPAAETVSSGPPTDVGPALAAPAGGLPAVAAWTRSRGRGDPGSIVASKRGPSGWSAPRALSVPIAKYALRGDGAAATDSTVAVVWSALYKDQNRLYYAARDGAGTFGAPRPLSAGSGDYPVLAANEHTIVAVWLVRRRQTDSIAMSMLASP